LSQAQALNHLTISGEFLDFIRCGGLIFFVSFFYQEKKENEA